MKIGAYRMLVRTVERTAGATCIWDDGAGVCTVRQLNLLNRTAHN